jgi:hypothetical protein
MARAAHIAALQDARAAQPVSHMLLRFDSPDGSEDRVRVALRGTMVGAAMDIRDADSAAQVTRGLPDLARALEAVGLESGSLRVQSLGTKEAALGNPLGFAAGSRDAISDGTLFAQSGSAFAHGRGDAPDSQAQREAPRQRAQRGSRERKP